jgi:hypothetical protein
MDLQEYIFRLKNLPENILFGDTVFIIDIYYIFEPTKFKNAKILNKIDENNGSCKIFAFGLLNKLNESEVLHCFGDYYRKDVLMDPFSANHQNIRSFIKNGWSGIQFEKEALRLKIS